MTIHIQPMRSPGSTDVLRHVSRNARLQLGRRVLVVLLALGLVACAPIGRPPIFPETTPNRSGAGNSGEYPFLDSTSRPAPFASAATRVTRECDTGYRPLLCSGRNPDGEEIHLVISTCDFADEWEQARERLAQRQVSWRSLAETYGNTSQLSRRLRDALAIASGVNIIRGATSTSLYYALGAILADRIPDILASEKQQAIYLLAADAASCYGTAFARAELATADICRFEIALHQTQRNERELAGAAENLVRQTQQHRCKTSDSDKPAAVALPSEYLKQITAAGKSPHVSCKAGGEVFLDRFKKLRQRSAESQDKLKMALTERKQIPIDFIRHIDRLAYAVAGDQASADASAMSGMQVGSEMTQFAGVAQSGAPRDHLTTAALAYGDNGREFLARQLDLTVTLAELDAMTNYVNGLRREAKKAADACAGIYGRNSLVVTPAVARIEFARSSPAFIIEAQDEAAPPEHRITGSGTTAFNVQRSVNGNRSVLSLTVNSANLKNATDYFADLTFVSTDGKRQSSPIRLHLYTGNAS